MFSSEAGFSEQLLISAGRRLWQDLLSFSSQPCRTLFFNVRASKKDVINSTTYEYVEYYAINNTPALYNLKETIEVLGNPEKMAHLETNTDYQLFINNPKVQALINDKETMRQMKDKNILQLIDNPKIKAVFTDNELMKRFTNIGHRIYKNKTEKTERLKKEMEKVLEQEKSLPDTEF